MKLFGKVHWVAVDCLTGQFNRVEHLPFEIGAGEGVDVPRPKELTLAEKQNELIRKQQEIDRAEADKRIAEAAAKIEAEHAALMQGR